MEFKMEGDMLTLEDNPIAIITTSDESGKELILRTLNGCFMLEEKLKEAMAGWQEARELNAELNAIVREMAA